ncbi:hypothetical protein [Anaeromassilibacillus sp. An200]|uniref:hypothetical protein n=1 Tax=Anaeromassilibacillus sp. An200 TaxID=1965587 RepID=UPI00111D8A83|nr:hypothetical protein [Anaeromassilibacillus sp. An200]
MPTYSITLEFDTSEESLLEKIPLANVAEIHDAIASAAKNALKAYCHVDWCESHFSQKAPLLLSDAKNHPFVQDVRASCGWCFGCRYADTCSQDSNFCNSENDKYEMKDY